MEITRPRFANASLGNAPSALDQIHDRDISIAIYQRSIAHLEAELLPFRSQQVEFRSSGEPDALVDALGAYLESQSLECLHLLADIRTQARYFSTLSGALDLKLFFSTIQSSMCRRFHTDINDLRLLCTYIGQGTLWLPEEAVNRHAYHNKGKNQDIVQDHALIQQAQTGEVLIMKGALYPEGEALLHRSPTLNAADEQRLMLRIDTNQMLDF